MHSEMITEYPFVDLINLYPEVKRGARNYGITWLGEGEDQRTGVRRCVRCVDNVKGVNYYHDNGLD